LQEFAGAAERVGVDKNTAMGALGGLSQTLNDARYGRKIHQVIYRKGKPRSTEQKPVRARELNLPTLRTQPVPAPQNRDSQSHPAAGNDQGIGARYPPAQDGHDESDRPPERRSHRD
jgi:hypothetical protein